MWACCSREPWPCAGGQPRRGGSSPAVYMWGKRKSHCAYSVIPVLNSSGSFRAVRLPRQVARAAEMLCHSWISMQSNKHSWPEFYPANARACPDLEQPMLNSTVIQTLASSCRQKCSFNCYFTWLTSERKSIVRFSAIVPERKGCTTTAKSLYPLAA